eukprot:TRINITY_DN19509_c0_g1_i1.p1 TRINITY_DN19509_c0_g1~~TRINITY_DN19509_c0_g1_i1.p1  ORF type:complete len:322 (+),score=92.96 TRINITY_DN19509_c0_g1_i1:173-1138(+)
MPSSLEEFLERMRAKQGGACPHDLRPSVLRLQQPPPEKGPQKTKRAAGDAEEPAPKRAKEADENPPPAKRKPGRPRKAAPADAPPSNGAAAAAAPPPPKKKPGRPRKDVAAAANGAPSPATPASPPAAASAAKAGNAGAAAAVARRERREAELGGLRTRYDAKKQAFLAKLRRLKENQMIEEAKIRLRYAARHELPPDHNRCVACAAAVPETASGTLDCCLCRRVMCKPCAGRAGPAARRQCDLCAEWLCADCWSASTQFQCQCNDCDWDHVCEACAKGEGRACGEAGCAAWPLYTDACRKAHRAGRDCPTQADPPDDTAL